MLIIFILLVGLAVMVFSITTTITARVTESGYKKSRSQVFYIAEAGLNKAIWYLRTSVSDGGKGPLWRTPGTTEAFGKGSYTITVSDTATPGEILVAVTGEAGGQTKGISQIMTAGSLPGAFEYSVYGGSNVSIGRGFTITGDMFTDGNTVFDGTGTAGNVYHTEGYSVSGSGTYTDAGVPEQPPEFPVLDTSYYDGLVGDAAGYPAGNQTLSGTVNLDGGTIYINGDVDNAWGATINGPGTIVVTGRFDFNGILRGNDDEVIMVAGTSINMQNSTISNTTCYSGGGISFSREIIANKTVILANTNISSSGDITLGGMIYSKSGQIIISNTANFTGSIVAYNGVVANKAEVVIAFDVTELPGNAPKGFGGEGDLVPKKGTWKEF
ncbi:hypothetical protein ACFL4F_00390 [Candidatus Margulisiibacteriota bacterium]